jgi:glutathione synthase/RimK-type ligase-like ATP-grasp enzyme
VAELVIDRLQDRALAEVIFSVPLFGSPKMIGAGFAARANRLDIAVRLAMVGLNRPHAFAIHDEVSGLEAAESATYPATFFPLQPKSAGLTLWDRDTAEAVLEHREMLGQRGDTLGLVQAGDGSASIRVIVVNGIAAGYEGSEALAGDPAYQLAQKAAAALDAEVIGVVLVQGAQGMEIWDIDPAPDFRNATAIGHASVASAIAARVTELANVTVARS